MKCEHCNNYFPGCGSEDCPHCGTRFDEPLHAEPDERVVGDDRQVEKGVTMKFLDEMTLDEIGSRIDHETDILHEPCDANTPLREDDTDPKKKL